MEASSCKSRQIQIVAHFFWRSRAGCIPASVRASAANITRSGRRAETRVIQTRKSMQMYVEATKQVPKTAVCESRKTYGLHHQDQNTVEMCTFVCKVHENSPSQTAGLKVGDTIASVNDTSVEGYLHKDIVQLIKACGDSLRLETVYSDSIRKAELEARLQYLKQTLYEKWDEYRSLMVQEQRLVHGIVMSDAAIYESLESAGVYGSLGAPSPATRRALRGSSSTSSSASFLTAEDDPLYQTCLYQVDGNPESDHQRKEQQPPQRPQRLRPTSEVLTVTKTQLTRSASTRSYMRGSSSSAGSGEKNGGFGSLQRKPKQKSFRRRLLKFIPGLNRPLEEEESKL
uniref:GRP1 (General receptor for phosphoinositides 1)-associated scaffold protein n=1 Tax=Nothobranchius pienaari TaxID=704102 RepID=A0A1A8N260_9TELE